MRRTKKSRRKATRHAPEEDDEYDERGTSRHDDEEKEGQGDEMER